MQAKNKSKHKTKVYNKNLLSCDVTTPCRSCHYFSVIRRVDLPACHNWHPAVFKLAWQSWFVCFHPSILCVNTGDCMGKGGAVCILSSKHSEISLFPGKETVKLSSAFSCNFSFKNNRPCLLILNFVLFQNRRFSCIDQHLTPTQ